MQGADEPIRTPKTLFTFNSREDMQQYATGCDADIGGTSTVHLDLDETSVLPASMSPTGKEIHRPTAKFWGDMRLAVRKGYEDQIWGGYAAFRSKPRTTLFGEITDDVSMHRLLALRLRAGGHPRTRNSYYVNIQTDGPIETDLWQHRLFFRRDDGGWEDIFIPFEDFVLTNAGEVSPVQLEMYRERIRTIGISILGAKNGVEGPYELGIDSIRAVNDEDMTVDAAPRKELSEGTQWERHAV
ncbi:NADH:ubiquinone oxidoreductase complex I intermediate-associated protein 30 [Laetiporus sulphureus 93-53]|uniref:NADH:ubiquinone oxidoreductase complex I intermediate-associated protein 30 n=1 Tax=Laetiporus sulphureus 93-53 TaxID=1314785 RepID=A0A165E0Z5_9APHY|nr:NADH:ubiquinone oxidoreductase complex I intermediate-associated protein 30 [Laetiporus sulphureus 93-53]KZT06038.1 NADH:ubiquinone oxidoreductase complex I intermediate-associated protein 30 [Laetiporus sulphureus 93-53]